MNVVKEIVLPRRPPKNPDPSLSPGGDCGACTLAGVLGISVQEAYNLHCSGDYYGGSPIPQVSPFTIYSMRKTLESIVNDWGDESDKKDLLEHAVTDIPIWPYDSSLILNAAFGMRSVLMCMGWRNHTRAMLHGGYYGIAQVWHGGTGGTPNLRDYGTTNHWIIIAGHRLVYEKTELCGSLREEILVCDSSTAMPLERWIEVLEFLTQWGGFAALWAKPAA